MPLIVVVDNFAILGKKFPQWHLIILRQCAQNSIASILKHFNNFPFIPLSRIPIPLFPPFLPLPLPLTYTKITTSFPKALIIRDNRVFLDVKIAAEILYHRFYYQDIGIFFYYDKTYSSKRDEDFERETHSQEIVRCLCESLVVLLVL